MGKILLIYLTIFFHFTPVKAAEDADQKHHSLKVQYVRIAPALAV